MDSIISAETLLLAYKYMFIGSLVAYAIFALVLIQQIKLERETVQTALGGALELAAIIHFVISLLLLFFSILIL